MYGLHHKGVQTFFNWAVLKSKP